MKPLIYYFVLSPVVLRTYSWPCLQGSLLAGSEDSVVLGIKVGSLLFNANAVATVLPLCLPEISNSFFRRFCSS